MPNFSNLVDNNGQYTTPVNFKTKISSRIWAFISFLCFYSQISFGQSHSYIHYSVPEGLPSSEVYQVHQDRNGFIWFATDNGVVRYDGYKMETFHVNDGLSDEVVFGIVEDPKGRIWFRTFSGKLSYFSNKKIHTYGFNDELFEICKFSWLQSIYIDSLDNVWFCGGYFMGKINTKGEMQKDSCEDFELTIKEIENQFIGSGVASINTVKFNEKRYRIQLNDKTHNRPINCVIHWKGEEYFSVGATIFKVNQESVIPIFIGKDQIISLSKDLNDNLWIGYMQKGVEGIKSFADPQPFSFPFLNSKSVSSIIQDSQGGYWASTLEDGVYYIPELILLKETILKHKKIKVVLSQDDLTFIGDESGLLSILNASGKIMMQKKFDGHSILSIFLDTEKNIWISTNYQTYIFDAQLNLKKRILRSLSSISIDANGFILGKSGFRTYKFNLKGDSISGYINENSRFIYSTKKNIYMFGRLGLYVFTPSLHKVKIPKSFESLKISKVVELNNSSILLTTLGSGFYVVNINNWSYQHYDSKRNFIADNIYAALMVDSTLWLGTENGVATTKVQSLLLNSPSFQFYTKRNGLPSNRIVNLSYSNPNIWAFYDDGFSLLPANLSNKKQDVPTFYLKDVLINNQTDSLETLNKLKFDQNNIQINFGFIDLRNQNILIRYRLSSLSHWIYTSERNVKFFLSPGNYSFELEYSTDNFHWLSALKHPISVSPQWWMNWRIQLTLFLILCVAGFLYYRRRIHLLREKQNLLRIINEQQHKLIRAIRNTRV